MIDYDFGECDVCGNPLEETSKHIYCDECCEPRCLDAVKDLVDRLTKAEAKIEKLQKKIDVIEDDAVHFRPDHPGSMPFSCRKLIRPFRTREECLDAFWRSFGIEPEKVNPEP